LAALLDGHSQITVFPEETFYLNIATSPSGVTVEAAAERLMEEITRKVSGRGNPDVPDQWRYTYFEDLDAFWSRFRSHLQEGTKTHDHVLNSLITAYAEETGQAGRRYWLEESNGNERHLTLLRSWYPSMYAIYVVRDPRDVYPSWAQRMRASRKSDAIENFVLRWGMSVWHWRQYSGTHENSLTLRYEDLLRYPEETMRLICRFLDIEYEPDLRNPTKNGMLWTGDSLHGNQDAGISVRRREIGHWQKRLSAVHIAFIESYLGKAMLEFGYQRTTGAPSLFDVINHMRRCRQKKAQIMGMVLRLYWPFRLPKRLRGSDTP
jgi:hypothetical protein